MEEKNVIKNDFKPTVDFYEQFRKPIIRMLSFKCGLDRYSAEDIFQDTYFSYVQALDKLQINDSEKDTMNWIFKACTNCFKREFRFDNRHKSKYIDKHSRIYLEELEYDVSGINSYSSYVEDHFIQGLNKVEKKIYTHIKEGYSLDEICKKFKTRKSYAFVSKNFNNLKKYVREQI